MGVITSNRGASRSGIFSNILELPARVFIAGNVCGQIIGNVLMNYGILNNEVFELNYNRAGAINDNVVRRISLNTVENSIDFNTTTSNKQIALNIVGELTENRCGNIMGNIANSIDLNGPIVGTIGGNIINGSISLNNINGDIVSNYTGDIKNNY